MGFFASGQKVSTTVKSNPSVELLHKLGCRACPLNKAEHIQSPKMDASGSNEPLIYVLGEGPGEIEDQEGKQFVGPSGQFLWPFFPGNLRAQIRRNNVVNCRTSLDNRDPDKIEIECCRPRIEKDIEETQPDAIFGLGGVALAWADKPGGIELWRGRRFPIRIGRHTCWYYPMRHPSAILHSKANSWRSDDEVAFNFDIRRAIAEVEAGLPEPIVHTPEQARNNITCINGRSGKDLYRVLAFLEYAGTCGLVGVDYETQNLRPYLKDSVILTKAVSTANETLAFAYEHPQAGWSSSDLELLRDAWVKFLKSPAKKAVHNLAFEIEWTCYFYGIDLAHNVPWEDTQTQAFVLDERIGDSKPGALALEFITLQYYGINIKKLTQGLNKNNMKAEPLSVLLPYNGIDAKYHRLDYIKQNQRIIDEGLVEVYQEKLRQVPTVVLTQMKGVPIDSKANEELLKDYEKKLEVIEEKIEALPEAKQFRRLTNQKFNPGSPQDVIVILRDILKTREGQEGKGWSTDKTVLGKIGLPITKGVLEYREVVKLKGTYVEPFSPNSPNIYNGDTLHCHYGTTLTETGRLQSEDPNLQNIPIRSAEGKKVRRQVKSKVIASFDLGQIDARGIACESRDKSYCKALWTGFDVHAEWARRLALHHPDFVGGKKGLDDPKEMKKFRDFCKGTWTFALFYGAALKTTAGRYRVEESVLRPLYDEFWKEFAGVHDWQDRLMKQFDELGYVQLSGGLRRRAPLGKGQIINTGIQGATNRIIMDSMNRLSEMGDWTLQANMQIHDDLTFCFESEKVFEDKVETILDTMLVYEAFPWICVPITVELKIGSNWAEMEEIGSYSSDKWCNWPIRAKEFM